MRNIARQATAGTAILALLTLCAGCRSPWVQATVANRQNTPVQLVEVDYPGGTFGVQTIAAHASYHYRFHILDSGSITLDFTDSANHSHTSKGPEVRPGQQGTLRIDIEPDGKVTWQPSLTSPK